MLVDVTKDEDELRPPEIELPAIAEVEPPETDEELEGRAFGTEAGFKLIVLFRNE